MYPGIGRGTVSSEFSTLRTAMNAQAVLRAGVTSVSVPGGAWFSDVAVREAINAGLIEGPRIFCAGRLLSVLGGGGDREPHWVGTPTMRSASSATAPTKWSPRCGAKPNTTSISSN